jgi:hypothetical protein
VDLLKKCGGKIFSAEMAYILCDLAAKDNYESFKASASDNRPAAPPNDDANCGSRDLFTRSLYSAGSCGCRGRRLHARLRPSKRATLGGEQRKHHGELGWADEAQGGKRGVGVCVCGGGDEVRLRGR